MADHRPRECCPRFRGDLDRTWGEEFVVRLHQANVEHRTRLRKATAWQALNVQYRNFRLRDYLQMKLIPPLRSRRALWIRLKSAECNSSRKSSSRSCRVTGI